MKQHSNKKMAVIGAGLGLLVITATSSVANADTPLDPIVCDVTGTAGLDLLCPGTNPLPDLPTPPLPVELPPVTVPELPIELPSLPAVTVPSLPINLPDLPELTVPDLDLPAITLPDLQGGSVGGAASGTVDIDAPGVAVDAAASGTGEIASCDQPAAVASQASGSAAIVASGDLNTDTRGSGNGGLSLPETAGLLAVVLTVVKATVPKVLSLVTGLLG